MKVKDEKGRILSSENPVIVGMWKKAGYTEISGKDEKPINGEPQPELGMLIVMSAAGTNTGDTKITVEPSKADGNSYKYKVGDSATNVTYGQNVKTWSAWDGTSDISVTSGKTITIVECDSIYGALKAGYATVTAQE